MQQMSDSHNILEKYTTLGDGSEDDNTSSVGDTGLDNESDHQYGSQLEMEAENHTQNNKVNKGKENADSPRAKNG
jgi:hypothetical protein